MRLDSQAATRSLMLLSALVASVFLAFLLSATGGRFVPAITDLYVVCQYAKAMAEGHPFQYNAGDPASSGATSLLHTLLLAGAHGVGFRGEGLIAFAVALGASLYVASVLLARRLGERLAGPREGALAGALVALGGPVVWGFLYGSDIALFLFLSLLLFGGVVVAASGGPVAPAVVAASLLALARPEGLPLALILGVAWWRRPERLRRFAFAPALAAGAGVLALNRALTGCWLGSSVADKSLFANYGFAEGLTLVAEYCVDVARGVLLGMYPSQAAIGLARGWAPIMFPPLGLLLVMLALVKLEQPSRRAASVWCAALLMVALLDVPSVFLGVHFNRYILWTFPSLLVLVAVGTGQLARLLGAGDKAIEARSFAAIAALLLALGAVSTLRFAAFYGEMAGEIARRDVAMALRIRATLPPGVPIANAATSVEYLTGHRNLNLHGVTSPAFFGGRSAEREVSMLEGLARLPLSERPEWLLSSDAAQQASATLRELAPGPSVFRTTTGSDELLLLRTHWEPFAAAAASLLPETQLAIAGRHEVDRLNVGDGPDEAQHDYSFRSSLGNLRLQGTPRIAGYALAEGELRVADGGRAILGEESFAVRASGGQELVLVMRTAPEIEARVVRASGPLSLGLAFEEAQLSVSSEGRLLAKTSLRPRAGWDELVVRLPGDAVRNGQTRLTVAGRYASFRYWFYQ